jgi:hypothetical protein
MVMYDGADLVEGEGGLVCIALWLEGSLEAVE